MGSVGDAYDSAMCESFFATLECELLDRSRFPTPADARREVFGFIEGFYNTRRIHSALGYESPANFERLNHAACIVPPISLDSSLANVPGSKGEEALNVSEIERAGPGEQPRKAEVVLRLLRGEDIGEVSREVRVAPPELERWRRVFLDGGQQGLKGKNRAGGELMRTRAKLGEMTMRVELPAELLEKRGYGDELRKLLKHSGG